MTIAIDVRVVSHPVPVDGPAHAVLYECCAALIVAVMVVLYFDERVRRDLSARLRGYAIGSLGGIIGTGLLIPLFALAGFKIRSAILAAFHLPWLVASVMASHCVLPRTASASGCLMLAATVAHRPLRYRVG